MRILTFIALQLVLGLFLGQAALGQTCAGRQTFTDPQGTFDDGSGPEQYGSNLSCEWLIQPAGANFLRVSFDSFATEGGFDFVAVFDGPTQDSPLLGRYSGFEVPPAVFTTQGAALVVFITDTSVTDQGWQISYQTVDEMPTCQGRQFIDLLEGAIEDGSGPANYTRNLDCEWTLWNPSQEVLPLQLSFEALNTEAENDVVEIYQGFDRQSPLIGRYSGRTLPDLIEVQTLGVLVVFRTNDSVAGEGWRIRYQWMTPPPTCEGRQTFTDPQGSFEDGSGPDADYGNFLNCEWLIQPPSANFLRLTFEAFSTENGYDLVTVYDGPTTASPVLGRYTGAGLPPELLTTQGAALIVFTSDESVASAGWRLRYESGEERPTCFGRQNLNTLEGAIEDGSADANYGNSMDCEWLIVNPELDTIPLQLTFEALSTEADVDVIEIYAGDTRNAPLIGTYSGQTLPAVIELEADKVLVVFRTNEAETDAGWSLRYKWFIPGPSCEGRTDLTETSGVVEDGSGPANYANKLRCEWLIAPQGAEALRLTFEEFSTEDGYDGLIVFDGPTEDSPRLATLTGRTLPDPVETTQGQALIVFITDESRSDAGWRLRYESIDGPGSPCTGRQTLTEPQGSFEDGSRADNYFSNLDCEWLIQPAGATSIEIWFDEFNTEEVFDYVEIYDGPEAIITRRLEQLSGSQLPASIRTTQGAALVRFVTDASGSGAGWRLNYAAEGTARNAAASAGIQQLELAPNPATDVCALSLTAAKAQQATLRLIDATGRLIESRDLSLEAGQNRFTIDVAAWPAGMYGVQLQTADGTTTARLLKP